MAGSGLVDVDKVFLSHEAPESNAAARRSELLALSALVTAKVGFSSSITDYTGGGSTKLDGVVTVGLTVPYLAILVVNGVCRIWVLVAGTDAEDAAHGVVRPDDYNASTNARVWKQVL